MSLVVTSEYAINRVVAPRLPSAPAMYSAAYQEQLGNILRLYFNQLDNIIGQLMATDSSVPITIGGTNTDAFGRIRTSSPYTLFDSQNRYAVDNQFNTSTATGGSTTYLSNQSSVRMDVTAASGSSVIRQTNRVFPYQPGKGLLVLATFVMGAPKGGLRQRVGYFNTDNGVFFQLNGSNKSFVLRSFISGAPSDSREVLQANWNGDKLDGTGVSGLTLDATKAQILWMDFEWLGVGSVRCGFIIDGVYIVCHTFQNANIISSVYMSTAILPVRYEITNTAATASASSLIQVCSSVVSEGGYEQTSVTHTARRTSAVASIGTTFVPLVSVRLAGTALGAVVLPASIQALPTTSQNYEVALFKNPTLTGVSWSALPSNTNIEADTAATAVSGGTLVQTAYITSSGSGGTTPLNVGTGYNWDLQLGVTLAGVSDILTLAIRTLTATPSGDAYGSIALYDLTQ